MRQSTDECLAESPASSPLASRNLHFVVRAATSAEDRERIFRFRYDVYIREMGRVQHHADHARERIEEPLDATARLYLAESRDGEVVGTIRTNHSRVGTLGIYPELYGMRWALAAFPDGCSVSTKLIVDRRYRSGLRAGVLSAALAQAGYRDLLADGVLLDFCDCSTTATESFLRRLGYRRYAPRVIHPEYGEVRLLVLLLRDRGFLERAGSPFAADLWPAGADVPAETVAQTLAAYRTCAAAHDLVEE